METKSQVLTMPEDFTKDQQTELFFKATQLLDQQLNKTAPFPNVIALPSPRLSAIHIWVENAHIVISQTGIAYIKD
jgi:hypothetical protein